jgi:hypothetical protein
LKPPLGLCQLSNSLKVVHQTLTAVYPPSAV